MALTSAAAAARPRGLRPAKWVTIPPDAVHLLAGAGRPADRDLADERVRQALPPGLRARAVGYVRVRFAPPADGPGPAKAPPVGVKLVPLDGLRDAYLLLDFAVLLWSQPVGQGLDVNGLQFALLPDGDARPGGGLPVARPPVAAPADGAAQPSVVGEFGEVGWLADAKWVLDPEKWKTVSLAPAGGDWVVVLLANNDLSPAGLIEACDRVAAEQTKSPQVGRFPYFAPYLEVNR